MITKIETIELPGFYVAGIKLRTTNQGGQSQTDIGELWARFMSEDVLLQIPNRISDDIYSVYTEYESDHTGAYTAVLGCVVSSIPEGFTCIDIYPGKYHVNWVEGKLPDSIMEAWRQIWNNSTDRKYTADFEVYSANAKSFEETEVKIYLAVN
jgi:predicted transcriptional regulator YdeE